MRRFVCGLLIILILAWYIMSARRCSRCGTNWPIGGTYRECPICLEPTSWIGNAIALLPDEAKRLKAEADFEHYYERWERVRQQQGKPSPDERGTAEGREIRELERLWRES